MIFAVLARQIRLATSKEEIHRDARCVDAGVDAELVRRCLEGDRGAFDSLYHRHARITWHRLARLVGPDAELEDLLQQVFLEAYRSLPSFRHESSFSTWLYRITTNVALCRLRSRRRRPTEPLSEHALTALVAGDAGPEERMRTSELARQALEHLCALGPKFQVAFVLRHVEGLSLQEMAVILNANAPAVAQRVKKAERLLAERFARDESLGATR